MVGVAEATAVVAMTPQTDQETLEETPIRKHGDTSSAGERSRDLVSGDTNAHEQSIRMKSGTKATSNRFI